MPFGSIMMPHPAFWSVLTRVRCHFHLEWTTVTQTTGSCRKPTVTFDEEHGRWSDVAAPYMIIFIPSEPVLSSSHTRSQQRTKRFHCSLPVCLFAALSLSKHMGWPTGCLSVRQQNNETWHIYSNIAGKSPLTQPPRPADRTRSVLSALCVWFGWWQIKAREGVSMCEAHFTLAAHPWANICRSHKAKQIINEGKSTFFERVPGFCTFDSLIQHVGTVYVPLVCSFSCKLLKGRFSSPPS